MGLTGLFCRLCKLFDIVGMICSVIDRIVTNNELICEKINEVIGDPDAPCDCEEGEPEGIVAAEQVRTEEVRAVTAKIQESAATLTAQFSATTKQLAEKGE